jgi:hypothetical protein
MGFLSSTNAGAAKVIGLGTVVLAIFVIGQWGILAALFLATAGGVLFLGAGDELPRFSIRNFGLSCSTGYSCSWESASGSTNIENREELDSRLSTDSTDNDLTTALREISWEYRDAGHSLWLYRNPLVGRR